MSWEFNNVGIFFLPVLFEIFIARFGPFSYVICGIYSFIKLKILLSKTTSGVPVWNLIVAPVLIFVFHVNLSCCWSETLIACFKVLILSFKIFISILSALISSAKTMMEGPCFLHSYSVSGQVTLNWKQNSYNECCMQLQVVIQ